MEKIYSWERYDRKTEYCKDVIEVIDYTSWECLKELGLAMCRFTVEDAFREITESGVDFCKYEDEE